MKSVLISIQPKWVVKIASGQKTIEVRKSKPNLATPFKCYIYQTKKFTQVDIADGVNKYRPFLRQNQGKVIGEFICDSIEDFSKWEFDYSSLLRHINLYAGTNGDYKFLDNYLKGEKAGYGWHISDLKIYDKAKELSEFRKPCDRFLDCITCKRLVRNDFLSCDNIITRPPQSWCYVEGE